MKKLNKTTPDWQKRAKETLTSNPSPTKLSFAQHLRDNETRYERELGYMIRRKLHDVRFWRQTVIQGYILDFYFPDLYVGIELDGKHHDPVKDFRRDKVLLQAGVRILRFPNPTSVPEINSVYSRIYAEIRYQQNRKNPVFPHNPQGLSSQQDLSNLDIELLCWNDKYSGNVENRVKTKNPFELVKEKHCANPETPVQKGCRRQAFASISVAQNEVRRLVNNGRKATTEKCQECRMIHVKEIS